MGNVFGLPHNNFATVICNLKDLSISKKQSIMGKVFRVTPKRIKRTNGQVLTPEMEVTVTTRMYTADPFYNGAQEIKDMYMRIYGFDYKKACCNKSDFEHKALD